MRVGLQLQVGHSSGSPRLVEHKLRQRVGVLSVDGVDERITVKKSSEKVGASWYASREIA
jgi:hypothetical protein